MKEPPFADPNVKAVFERFPSAVQPQLMQLRKLVFEAASETEGTGTLVETLKWGQPSYLTERPKTGSTVRLGTFKDGGYGLFFHCQSSLIPTFRDLYRDELTFEGNRAIRFDEADQVPEEIVKHCVGLALIYHRQKKVA